MLSTHKLFSKRTFVLMYASGSGGTFAVEQEPFVQRRTIHTTKMLLPFPEPLNLRRTGNRNFNRFADQCADLFAQHNSFQIAGRI